MSATPIESFTRYFLPGTTKILITPVIANLAVGATRAEITASTDVSEEVAAISGWSITSQNQDAPDLGGRFVQQIAGRLSAAESSITFYNDKAGADIRDLLELDQETYVVLLDGGDVAASPMDCYKVTVTSLAKMREIEGIGRTQVTFAIRAYAENLVVPATA